MISSEQRLTGEFRHLAAALAEGPDNWMPGPVENSTARIAELSGETHFGRFSRHARIQVGPAEVLHDQVIVPISWRALDGAALFPTFYGELRLLRRSDARSRLELRGYYEPPFGVVGRTADAVLMKAVAEATLEDFVERVAGVLGRNALARSVKDQVDAGRLTLDGSE